MSIKFLSQQFLSENSHIFNKDKKSFIKKLCANQKVWIADKKVASDSDEEQINVTPIQQYLNDYIRFLLHLQQNNYVLENDEQYNEGLVRVRVFTNVEKEQIIIKTFEDQKITQERFKRRQLLQQLFYETAILKFYENGQVLEELIDFDTDIKEIKSYILIVQENYNEANQIHYYDKKIFNEINLILDKGGYLYNKSDKSIYSSQLLECLHGEGSFNINKYHPLAQLQNVIEIDINQSSIYFRNLIRKSRYLKESVKENLQLKEYENTEQNQFIKDFSVVNEQHTVMKCTFSRKEQQKMIYETQIINYISTLYQLSPIIKEEIIIIDKLSRKIFFYCVVKEKPSPNLKRQIQKWVEKQPQVFIKSQMQLVFYFFQLASYIVFLHSNNITYGDINLSSILISQDLSIRLLKFDQCIMFKEQIKQVSSKTSNEIPQDYKNKLVQKYFFQKDLINLQQVLRRLIRSCEQAGYEKDLLQYFLKSFDDIKYKSSSKLFQELQMAITIMPIQKQLIKDLRELPQVEHFSILLLTCLKENMVKLNNDFKLFNVINPAFALNIKNQKEINTLAKKQLLNSDKNSFKEILIQIALKIYDRTDQLQMKRYFTNYEGLYYLLFGDITYKNISYKLDQVMIKTTSLDLKKELFRFMLFYLASKQLELHDQWVLQILQFILRQNSKWYQKLEKYIIFIYIQLFKECRRIKDFDSTLKLLENFDQIIENQHFRNCRYLKEIFQIQEIIFDLSIKQQQQKVAINFIKKLSVFINKYFSHDQELALNVYKDSILNIKKIGLNNENNEVQLSLQFQTALIYRQQNNFKEAEELMSQIKELEDKKVSYELQYIHQKIEINEFSSSDVQDSLRVLSSQWKIDLIPFVNIYARIFHPNNFFDGVQIDDFIRENIDFSEFDEYYQEIVTHDKLKPFMLYKAFIFVLCLDQNIDFHNLLRLKFDEFTEENRIELLKNLHNDFKKYLIYTKTDEVEQQEEQNNIQAKMERLYEFSFQEEPPHQQNSDEEYEEIFYNDRQLSLNQEQSQSRFEFRIFNQLLGQIYDLPQSNAEQNAFHICYQICAEIYQELNVPIKPSAEKKILQLKKVTYEQKIMGSDLLDKLEQLIAQKDWIQSLNLIIFIIRTIQKSSRYESSNFNIDNLINFHILQQMTRDNDLLFVSNLFTQDYIHLFDHDNVEFINIATQNQRVFKLNFDFSKIFSDEQKILKLILTSTYTNIGNSEIELWKHKTNGNMAQYKLKNIKDKIYIRTPILNENQSKLYQKQVQKLMFEAAQIRFFYTANIIEEIIIVNPENNMIQLYYLMIQKEQNQVLKSQYQQFKDRCKYIPNSFMQITVSLLDNFSSDCKIGLIDSISQINELHLNRFKILYIKNYGFVSTYIIKNQNLYQNLNYLIQKLCEKQRIFVVEDFQNLKEDEVQKIFQQILKINKNQIDFQNNKSGLLDLERQNIFKLSKNQNNWYERLVESQIQSLIEKENIQNKIFDEIIIYCSKSQKILFYSIIQEKFNIILSELVNRSQTIKVNQTIKLYIILQIIQQLSVLYEHKIYYGQLSLENILIFDNFKVKLGDFKQSLLFRDDQQTQGLNCLSINSSDEFLNEQKYQIRFGFKCLHEQDIYSLFILINQLFDQEEYPFVKEFNKNYNERLDLQKVFIDLFRSFINQEVEGIRILQELNNLNLSLRQQFLFTKHYSIFLRTSQDLNISFSKESHESVIKYLEKFSEQIHEKLDEQEFQKLKQKGQLLDKSTIILIIEKNKLIEDDFFYTKQMQEKLKYYNYFKNSFNLQKQEITFENIEEKFNLLLKVKLIEDEDVLNLIQFYEFFLVTKDIKRSNKWCYKIYEHIRKFNFIQCTFIEKSFRKLLERLIEQFYNLGDFEKVSHLLKNFVTYNIQRICECCQRHLPIISILDIIVDVMIKYQKDEPFNTLIKMAKLSFQKSSFNFIQVRIYKNLGRVQMKVKKDYKKALKYFEKAILKTDDVFYSDLFILQAQCYQLMQEHSITQQVLSKIGNQNDLDGKLALLYYHFQIGNYQHKDIKDVLKNFEDKNHSILCTLIESYKSSLNTQAYDSYNRRILLSNFETLEIVVSKLSSQDQNENYLLHKGLLYLLCLNNMKRYQAVLDKFEKLEDYKKTSLIEDVFKEFQNKIELYKRLNRLNEKLLTADEKLLQTSLQHFEYMRWIRTQILLNGKILYSMDNSKMKINKIMLNKLYLNLSKSQDLEIKTIHSLNFQGQVSKSKSVIEGTGIRMYEGFTYIGQWKDNRWYGDGYQVYDGGLVLEDVNNKGIDNTQYYVKGVLLV